MAEENKSLFHFEAKGSDSGSEHRTSAVAGLLYGDSSRGVHIPNPDEVLKSILEQIKESIDKTRNSETEDEFIAKVRTMMSDTRETLDAIHKFGLIKENDLNLVKKFIDEIEVSLDK